MDIKIQFKRYVKQKTIIHSEVVASDGAGSIKITLVKKKIQSKYLRTIKIKNIMSSENRTSVPNSLNEHWMPFTSNKDFKANPRLITEAKGVYLKTHHGKTQIDASSGLFCNPLGHGRREITEAVTKQLETLKFNFKEM